MKKVFIDGSAGTTGLRIYERLEARPDIVLIRLPESERKEVAARRDALNSCDIAFLCLPDAAALEAAELVENPDVVLIDTSTAHRTAPDWIYGFPELFQDGELRIKSARRIAVPGCHASGFIALVRPLIDAGLLPPEAALTCHSITGYSGGGKTMIADYQAENRDSLLDAPRQYGLTQNHKHLREMKAITGLESPPIFCPIVSDFYSGMAVTVPIFRQQLASGANMADIQAVYAKQYTGPIVRFRACMDEAGFLSAASLSGKDSMEITVCGNAERMLLIARYDNLGKGASGAALECMNIVTDTEKTAGLIL